jgi:proteasome lid subunit RPN8/RPN11
MPKGEEPQGLVETAKWLMGSLNRLWLGPNCPVPPPDDIPPPSPKQYQPLRRVLLTDGVSRTLFEEYAIHRAGARGDEETGWVLLGIRDVDEALVLATLPAGAHRNAGAAHVQFNSGAQALASRIVRQHDRRVTMLGVVHTHPGSLRHPSDGDYRGDSQWVGQLRGKEGVFAIGTLEPAAKEHGRQRHGVGTNSGLSPLVASQPKPSVQRFGPFSLSWYSLRAGAAGYRALPVGLTLGPDLARDLHAVWLAVETQADHLDRLYRQQAGVSCAVVQGKDGPALAVTVPLAEPGDVVRVLLEGKDVRYYLVRDGELLMASPDAASVDQGVYLLLAELAGQS